MDRRHADMVFTGGPVLTATGVRHADVAVRDGRIVALGRDADGLTATETVDLAGGLLMPGFTDGHAHPVQAGLERMRCDLSSLDDRAGYLAAVADYATTHPAEAWITGGGWATSAFEGPGPLASDLDAVVPARPVFLPNRDHHSAWVNSAALRLAGIDHRTPDPSDGYLERDADGTPTGTLHEGAMHLVEQHKPVDTDDDLLSALLGAQRVLHSYGVTAWQDALVGEHANLRDTTQTYRTASDRGLLTARVVGALLWDRHTGSDQLADLIGRRERMRGPRLSASTVKIMQDGVPENFTAGMIDPYLDRDGRPGDRRGLSLVDPDELREVVLTLSRHGFQVHVHAIGDRAVRESLDAFEATRAAIGPHDLRHQIAHVQVVHPDDVPRFGRLGVAANVQMLWAAYDRQMLERNVPFLGPERTARQYPFASLAQTYGRLVAGSDWPVSSPNPWDAIQVAVTRRLPAHLADGDRPAFLPEQALTLDQALHAYTRGSAWANHSDDTGVVEEGALADLVVTDQDPFAVAADRISTTGVVATYVGGVLVHHR